MTKSYLIVITPAGLKKLPKPQDGQQPPQTVVELTEDEVTVYVVSGGKKAKKL